MSNPKRREMLDRVKSLTEVGRNTLLNLFDIFDEIGEPTDAINTMGSETHQPSPEMKARARREKIKNTLVLALFVILYILANSIAPTVWTPDGMAPIY